MSAALMASMIVSACSHPLLDSPQPPLAPRPDDVARTVGEFNTALTRAQISGLTPQEYTAAAYVTVEEKCNEFFDRLTLYKNNSSFYSAQVATAGAAAAGVLAILSASTTAIGLVGLGAGLVASTITNFQNFALVTPYPLETRQLVFAALAAAKEAKPAKSIEDIYDARSTVAAYAQYCTYSGIATLSQQAIERGARSLINATTSATDLLRSQVTALVGTPLTDYQLAMVVVLDGTLTAQQRQNAGNTANYSQAQRRALFDGNSYSLSQGGRRVAELVRNMTLTSPSLAGQVRDLTSTIVGGGTPPPPPAPSSAPVLESAPAPASRGPVPTVAPGIGGGVPLPTPRIMVR